MKFLNSAKVDKVFAEIHGGNIELNEMIRYARAGDIIFVYSIEALGKNIKAIIRFIVQTQENKVELFIKTENFDTSNELGKYVLNIIKALDKINGKNDKMERVDAPNKKGRIPRELSDLRAYERQVEEKTMSVKEVCQRLHIGRTTYYRRIKQLEGVMTEKVEDKGNEII
ncbi:DNA-invertase hin [Clostridium ljungdahlii]|uniref:DNA-invertase hin n=2 Tax=Clostridium ljungdahlii TaxID=1538 RepID=A0A168LQF8_9CLOT|nr:DNA-invertase hin [Clostridium ljungdahlii]